MRKVLTIAVGVVAALAGFAAVGGTSAAEPPAKITICHGTASNTNPYVQITVSEKSFKDGHFDDGPNNKSHGKNNNPDFVLEEGRTCADGPGGGTDGPADGGADDGTVDDGGDDGGGDDGGATTGATSAEGFVGCRSAGTPRTLPLRWVASSLAALTLPLLACGGSDEGDDTSAPGPSSIEVAVSDDSSAIAPLRDVTCRRVDDTQLVASGIVESNGDAAHYVSVAVRFVDGDGVRVEIASDSVSDLLVGEAARWEAVTYADGAPEVERCEVTATVS